MIVIDTHVLVWWLDVSVRLDDRVRARLNAENDVRLCAISWHEIALATSHGRMQLESSPKEWTAKAVRVATLRVEPLTPAMCFESTRLPGEFHRDPADRLIVATARLLDAELVTADGKMLAYPHVRTVRADR